MIFKSIGKIQHKVGLDEIDEIFEFQFLLGKVQQPYLHD